MRKVIIKTAGWAVITTIVFVGSAMWSGASFEVAALASIIGTTIKTPLYFFYETAMKAWL